MPEYEVTCDYATTTKMRAHFTITARDALQAEILTQKLDNNGSISYHEYDTQDSKTTYCANLIQPLETVESLKDDLRSLGEALRNLLSDINTAEIPTHTDSQGISAAIEEANTKLAALGFEKVPVTIRELMTCEPGEKGTHSISKNTRMIT